jgi:membrane-associated protease RseP (regulator of RpoE activity)
MIELSTEARAILSILAAFKFAELITIEIGPFAIFDRFRSQAGRWASGSRAKHSNISGFRSASTEFADLVNCPFCVGIWISFVLALLNLFPTFVGDAAIVFLAIAGGQSFLQTLSARHIQD